MRITFKYALHRLPLGVALMAGLGCMSAVAAEQPGVSATEIRIGQTMPYSGPVSAFGILGKGETAYFKMVNDRGGINGRKINLISLDDGYVPTKTVEQTRRLVENDEVAFIFSTMGTAQNTSINKYLQGKGVPQLFVASGATKFGDPAQFPLATMSVQAPFRQEARIYARYLLSQNPNAKFAILSQNDDFGREYLSGIRDVYGERFEQQVVSATYEFTDPTIDSQIVKLKSSGADALMIGATPKFAAQAIRKVFEVGWKPITFVSNVSVWISSVIEPAGFEASTGLVSSAYVKDPLDPAWSDDAGVKGWREFMAKYVPDGDVRDANYVNAYNNGMAIEHVLKAAGDDLSRENIMKQATRIKNLELPMLLPGIRIDTSETDHYPVEQMQLMRFSGKQWERFGDLQGEEKK